MASSAISTPKAIRCACEISPATPWSTLRKHLASSSGASSSSLKPNTQASPSTSRNSTTNWSRKRNFWSSITLNGKISQSSATFFKTWRTFKSLALPRTAKWSTQSTRQRTSLMRPRKKSCRLRGRERRSSWRNLWQAELRKNDSMRCAKRNSSMNSLLDLRRNASKWSSPKN